MSFMTTSSSHAPESVSLLNRTLSDEWHAVIVLRSSLPDTVPVNGDFHALHVILDIDDDAIVLADLDARPWDHSVGGQDTSLDAIG